MTLSPRDADSEDGDCVTWMSHLVPGSGDIINSNIVKHDKRGPPPNSSQQELLCKDTTPILVPFYLRSREVGTQGVEQGSPCPS